MEKEEGFGVVVLGPAGSGKTTFAISGAPRAMVIDLEGSSRWYKKMNPTMRRIDATNMTWPTFMALLEKIEQDQTFGSLVIDSADHLATVLVDHLYDVFKLDFQKDSLVNAGRGYGHGYDTMAKLWREMLKKLSQLLSTGKHVIITCHIDLHEGKTNLPGQQEFDRYSLRLPKKIAPFLTEWADLVGHLELSVREVEGERVRERVLCVNPDVHFLAKNRFGLPESRYRDQTFGSLLGHIQEALK